METRDLFAAAALIGLLPTLLKDAASLVTPKGIAQTAYGIADAMMDVGHPEHQEVICDRCGGHGRGKWVAPEDGKAAVDRLNCEKCKGTGKL